jgi:hypothetical protein
MPLVPVDPPLALALVAAPAGCANYYPEILRTEGISSFDLLELGNLNELAKYRIAILPSTPLSDAQASALASWVEGGGHLVSFRPDPKLYSLLGLTAQPGAASSGYIQVQGGAVIATPLQYHGPADRFEALADTRVLGRLLEPNRSASPFAALTLRENIGLGGGSAAAFAYDLACSVILTRQGNPALAGSTALDGVPRSSELFASFLDVQNFEIPQADEHQRLLVFLLHGMAGHQAPLPRLWYLPGGRKLAVVMTGDDHNAGGTPAFLDLLKSDTFSPAGCSPEQWTCARATSWIYSNVNGLKNGAAAARLAEGFELGPHVAMDRDGGCAAWANEADLLARFTARLQEFETEYGIPAAATNRSHCFVFADWDTQPKVEAKLGIRLDENYTPYALPGTKNRLGRLNGSAMPMRFTDRSGAIIDVYQLVSDMDYEYFDTGTSQSAMALAIGELLDGALGPNQFVGFVGTHYDYSGGLEADFRNALLEQIAARRVQSVAMISARQLLDWLDLRNGSSFRNVRFDGELLSFRLELAAGLPNPGLEGMLPAAAGDKQLVELELAGVQVPLVRSESVRSVPYAFFVAATGHYVATYE